MTHVTGNKPITYINFGFGVVMWYIGTLFGYVHGEPRGLNLKEKNLKQRMVIEILKEESTKVNVGRPRDGLLVLWSKTFIQFIRH